MKSIKTAILLFISLSLIACQQQEYHKLQGQTMGTFYHVTFKAEDKSIAHLAQHIEKRLKELNQNLSTYIDDSDLNRLNRTEAGKCVKVTKDTARVMAEALRIHRLSKGAFDPGLGPLIELWGFDKKDTGDKIPSAQEIAIKQQQLSFGQSKLDQSKPCVEKGSSNLYINFSAIAKGYAVDELASLLEHHYGIKQYLVEIGGELKAKGNNPAGQPWRVAIEAPDTDKRTVQKVINPDKMGVATSGDYRNYFEKDGKRYSHTIDPTTGYPIDHTLASITVVHPSTMTADALATAIMVMGDEKGRRFAEKHNLAVYMLSKSNEGFTEYHSDTFSQYLENKE